MRMSYLKTLKENEFMIWLDKLIQMLLIWELVLEALADLEEEESTF